jgi:8-oxo-dGTP diphosphatase
MRYVYCPFCGQPYGGQAKPPFKCRHCQAVVYDNPKPTATVLIERQGRLLIAKRGIEPMKGCWDLVGGFVEGAEHPAETAVREAKEETGLEVEITGMLDGAWMDTYGTSEIVTLNLAFLARPLTDDEPVPQDDVAELRWCAPDELPDPAEFGFNCNRGMIAGWLESRPLSPEEAERINQLLHRLIWRPQDPPEDQ